MILICGPLQPLGCKLVTSSHREVLALVWLKVYGVESFQGSEGVAFRVYSFGGGGLKDPGVIQRFPQSISPPSPPFQPAFELCPDHKRRLFTSDLAEEDDAKRLQLRLFF